MQTKKGMEKKWKYTEIVDLKPGTISVKVSNINFKRVKLSEIVSTNLIDRIERSKEKNREG